MNEIFEEIAKSFERTFIRQGRYKLFVEGLGNTLLIALVATLIGILIGVVIAIIKVLHKQTGKIKLLNAFAEVYTTLFRGTPIVVQLLIIYNVVFSSSREAVLIGMLAFGLNSGAYVAEIIRAGILAVDVGQTEAGRSLGLSQTTTMFSIVLPQAFKNILPALGNEFIAVIKETSVIGYLGVMDLTRAAELVISQTLDVYFPYISIALVYLALVYGLSALLKLMERRLARSDRS
ncbi:MAG: amino acid ABC transporter permease [Clostridia bacterium]|nr:amino acid ABC transporter permease [Clostridia bacterium]